MKKQIICIAIMSFMIVTPATAKIVPLIDASDILKNADTVFVGKTIERAKIVGEGTVASVRVERILRSGSDLKPGQIVSVETLDHLGGPDLQVNQYQLFPLRCQAQVCRSVMNFRAGWPAVGASTEASRNLASQAALEIAVARELAQVLAAGDVTLSSYSSSIPLAGNDATKWRASAGMVLESLPRQIASNVLRSVGTPTDPAAKLAITAARVRAGDLSSLPEVNDLMANDRADLEVARGYVASGLEEVSRPSKGLIPTLTIWMTAPNENVRTAAAAGLRHIGTQEVVAPLVKYGLSDSSQDVRFITLNALGEITGETPIMDKITFREREAQYTTFWRQRGAALATKSGGANASASTQGQAKATSELPAEFRLPTVNGKH